MLLDKGGGGGGGFARKKNMDNLRFWGKKSLHQPRYGVTDRLIHSS